MAENKLIRAGGSVYNAVAAGTLYFYNTHLCELARLRSFDSPIYSKFPANVAQRTNCSLSTWAVILARHE